MHGAIGVTDGQLKVSPHVVTQMIRAAHVPRNNGGMKNAVLSLIVGYSTPVCRA